MRVAPVPNAQALSSGTVNNQKACPPPPSMAQNLELFVLVKDWDEGSSTGYKFTRNSGSNPQKQREETVSNSAQDAVSPQPAGQEDAATCHCLYHQTSKARQLGAQGF